MNFSLLKVAKKVRRMASGWPATEPIASAARNMTSRTSTRRAMASTAVAMTIRPRARVIGGGTAVLPGRADRHDTPGRTGMREFWRDSDVAPDFRLVALLLALQL